MNILLPRKKKILIFGRKKSAISFFVTKNFKNVIYHDKKYQNEHVKIYRSSDVKDLKTKVTKVDKIYFVSEYNTNFSNFPINEQDILLAKELISFLYEDLDFKELLSIMLIPTFMNHRNDSVQNYFNFNDKANIEVLIYNEDIKHNLLYTAPINIRKLYYYYNYKTIIDGVQKYMIDNSLYPGVDLNLFERLFYKHRKPNAVTGNVVLYDIPPVSQDYHAVLYYDVLKKRKFFEGKFYDNIMKSGKFYSEDGELLFEGCL